MVQWAAPPTIDLLMHRFRCYGGVADGEIEFGETRESFGEIAAFLDRHMAK